MIFFILHAGLMSLGFLCFLLAYFVATTQRRKSWWLMIHRTAGLLGTLFMLSGGAAAIAAVAAEATGHLRSPHTWMGAFVIAIAFATPLLGLMQLKAIQIKAVGRVHRLFGRLLTGSALITILFGLRTAELI